MIHNFRFHTHVPSKKNSWGRRKNGTVGVLNSTTQTQIELLKLEARAYWRARSPLERAAIRFRFNAPFGRRFDLDNRAQTLLDVLKDAHVILDDNSMCVSTLSVERLIDPEESVEVEIAELPPWEKPKAKARTR